MPPEEDAVVRPQNQTSPERSTAQVFEKPCTTDVAGASPSTRVGRSTTGAPATALSRKVLSPQQSTAPRASSARASERWKAERWRAQPHRSHVANAVDARRPREHLIHGSACEPPIPSAPERSSDRVTHVARPKTNSSSASSTPSSVSTRMSIAPRESTSRRTTQRTVRSAVIAQTRLWPDAIARANTVSPAKREANARCAAVERSRRGSQRVRAKTTR
jgi:hypothetical protein